MNGEIIAGLGLARELLECDRDALVECGTCPLDGLPPDDQIIANSYTSAMKAVDAAAFELGRLTARATLAEYALRCTGWEHIPDACGGPVWKPPVNRVAAELRAVTAGRDALQAQVERLQAERDALAARLAEIGRAAPPSDHPEDDLEIGPVRRPSICTSAGNIGTGDLCTAYSETTGRCSHAAECDYQQHAPERVLGAELGRDLRAAHEELARQAEAAHAARQRIAPLTDERIEAEFERMLGPLRDAHDQDRYLAALSWYQRGARFAERAHRIGTEPARPCRTCGPEGCPDSTSCPREGGAA